MVTAHPGLASAQVIAAKNPAAPPPTTMICRLSMARERAKSGRRNQAARYPDNIGRIRPISPLREIEKRKRRGPTPRRLFCTHTAPQCRIQKLIGYVPAGGGGGV